MTLIQQIPARVPWSRPCVARLSLAKRSIPVEAKLTWWPDTHFALARGQWHTWDAEAGNGRSN
ncbi:hypothetical protein GCM10023155_47400 [Bremerella cremea]